MEPIAIVTVILAALYIVCRGPLLVAPAATVAVYRRMFSTTGRVRVFGSLLVLLAVPLVVTARQARIEHGGITILIEVMGWLAGAAAVLVIAAPRTAQRLIMAFWDAVPSDPVRRAIGAVNIAFGLGLGWIAFVAF
jgi:hypothetical protein